MITTGYRTWVYILSLALVFVIFPQGCGKPFESIPDGSTLTIDPTEAKFNNIYADTVQNFTVTARYPDGTPIPYAVLTVTGSFAVPNGMGLYQFYYYPGGSLVANTAVNSGFQAQTNADGTYTFSVVFSAGKLFEEDTIRVNSGTAAAEAVVANTAT